MSRLGLLLFNRGGIIWSPNSHFGNNVSIWDNITNLGFDKVLILCWLLFWPGFFIYSNQSKGS